MIDEKAASRKLQAASNKKLQAPLVAYKDYQLNHKKN
jgi:hypothetical protein